MNNKYQPPHNANEIIQDDEFIKWRIFRTPESTDYWEDFRKQSPQCEEELQKAIQLFSSMQFNHQPLSTADKHIIYQSILKRAKQQKRKKIIVMIGSSAAILLTVLLSLLYVTLIKKERSAQLFDQETIVGQTLPLEEVYLISGDKRTELTRNAQIVLTTEGKAVITDSSRNAKELLLAATNMNKLVVPKGKRTNLTLSDGTKVWLNSGTQFEFPGTFVNNTREVHVDGEVYLEVAHNPHSPFIVHTQNMNVIVQGTSFNVSAYNEDPEKSVVLVEGKVTVITDQSKTTELHPNEMIDFNGNAITKQVVDVAEYTSWRNGILIFNGTPMSEILKKIGRYYNVEFEGSDMNELYQQTFSGKLFLSNNLDSVMTSISILSSTVYQREGNNIEINIDNS